MNAPVRRLPAHPSRWVRPWRPERSIRVPRALEHRLPPTPKWAQSTGSEESAAQSPSVAEPARDEFRDRVDAVNKAPSTETGEGVGGTAPLASPTPLTPLAAMAQSLRASRADTAGREQSVVMDRAVHHRGRRLDRVRDLVGRGGLAFPRQADPDLAALGQALFRAHSTLVTVGTPKGGPGKTTEAAALGVLGARAVEPHGGSAVLVDPPTSTTPTPGASSACRPTRSRCERSSTP